MARYSKPTRPAMTVAVATLFAAATKAFRATPPKTSVEGVTDDLKGLCALALIGVAKRYDVSDDPVFDAAAEYLDFGEEAE